MIRSLKFISIPIMKRFIFLLLFLAPSFSANGPSFGATADECDSHSKSSNECFSIDGCYYADNGCSLCDQENFPHSDALRPEAEENACYKEIPLGKEYRNKEKECVHGAILTANNTQCTCDRNNGFILNSARNACTKIERPVTIHANVSEDFTRLCQMNKNCKIEDKDNLTLTVEDGNFVFKMTDQAHFNPASTYTRNLMEYKGLSKSADNCTDNLLLNKDTKPVSNDAENTLVSGNDHLDLYACWGTNFTINYSGNNYTVSDNCQNDTTCINGTIMAYPQNWGTPTGQVFDHWNCSDFEKSPGDRISDLVDQLDNTTAFTGSTITCTAKYNDCGRGYYCDATGRHPCPPGSTTAESNAKSISECYIGADTIFIDSSDDSFLLPLGTTKLYYNN